MKLPVIIASLALGILPAKGDTIKVASVRAVPPVGISLPYMTDSVTMDGKAFDIKKTLDSNAALALSRNGYTTTLANGAGIAAPQGAAHGLTALRFGFNADRFVKGQLVVKQLRDYKTYVNGKLVNSKDLQFTPGLTEITLLALTDSTNTDTLNIAITGDDLKGLSFAADGKHVYSMADMMLGEHYRSVSLSPSGDYLVTVYYNTKSDGSNLFRTVITYMPTGREVMRRGQFMDLKWMPGRDVLYFTRQGAGGRELVTFDPRTGEEKVLTGNLPEGGFTLSPKADYAILSVGQPHRPEHTGSLKRLEQPDDRMSGWRNRSALTLFDLKTGITRPLTFGQASVWLNDISADGRRLLLSFSRQDVNRAPFSRTTLVEMDAYTGKVDTLLADTAFLSSAFYSPDGSQVMMKASPAAFAGIGQETRAGQVPNAFDYRLYLLDIKSGAVKPLLRNFGPSVEGVTWSKGDGYVYFRATDRYDNGLFRLNPKTGKVFRYELPVSYVQGFTFASQERQPRAVFYGQTGERARDMYTCHLGDKPQVKTTRIGEIDFDALMADVKIGTCHNWDFRASRGDTIKGFYYLPPDFDESKQYPVIVYYYGGCTPTAKVLEFQYPFQVLAGQGYVVYVVEPSGAIGFGQEFAARHVNTWGQGSADDIIEGTKAFLKAHPWANASKVGCMGASYGGFMTQYLQTRTDIFAAAISHAGISNIASYWGGGYWGYTYGEAAQYGSYPWNNPELYVKQSPLFNADKINTPLLLLHGTVDTNVPTNESQQLFTALRILGRPVSYVQVDGENHVITNFNKQLAWQNVIFAWFAHWLKDEPTWWKTLYPDDKFGRK